MTVAAHALMAGAIEGTILRLCGCPDEWIVAAIGHGMIGGAMPDAVDWIAATFFGRPRWSIYSKMHHGWSYWWLMVFFPGFPLHTVVVDPGFHDPAKPSNWWPRLWWAELSGWAYAVPVLVVLLWRSQTFWTLAWTTLSFITR